ncbi:ABC transporter permease [Trichothermofontia sp.]
MPKPDSPLPEVVYTPDSRLQHPLALLKAMGQDLFASRELAWRLMVRDMSAQYRQSLLGFAWAFVPPIVTAIGLTLANNANVLNVGVTELPYPAYVMFSVSLWQTFTEALIGPLQAITTAKPMLVRINFPREAIILAKLGQIFVNFGIKLILIVGLFIWFKISVPWTIVLAPVALIHLIALGTGIGLILAPIGGLYEDVSKGLTLLIGIWLFFTPVIFPVPQSGLFATLVQLNPVTPLLVSARDLATVGMVPDSTPFWIASLFAIASLLLGWLIYRLSLPFVIERMSA